MTPATGERLLRFVGDKILFTLRGGGATGNQPSTINQQRALLRTNLGRAAAHRQEIPRPKLPAAAKTHTPTLALEVFISGIILDGNSPARFHKLMAATGLKKSPAHISVHDPSVNNC
jgi:hypothetical protein